MKQAHHPPKWVLMTILAIGILTVSTSALLIRLANASAGASGVGFSLVIAASRLTLAALVVLGIYRSPWQPTQQLKKPSSLALRYALLAGFTLAIHFAAWVTSLSYTSVAASTALVTTNPIWVALISWLWFKEKLTRLTLIGTGVALLGGLVIALGETTGDSHQALLGNGLALVGAWAVSFYLLLGREAQRLGLSLGQYVTIAYSAAAIVLLPLPLLLHTSYLGYPSITYGYILLMALVPQLIGHTSFNWAVRWVAPTLVTLVILLEPVVASVLAFLLFRESPGLPVIWGAAVLLIGVALAILGNRDVSTQSEPSL